MSQIKHYYLKLMDEHDDEAYALTRTALTFKVSPNQVKRELNRKAKPKPRKPRPQR